MTALMALIAYRQLGNIARTTGTDFIHKLKNDFFREETRILIDHVVEGRLIYREISGEDSEGTDSESEPDIEMAYFQVDKERILPAFPDDLKRQLLKKEYYLEVEVDDFLLGHFEDIGLFEETGLIDTIMAFEEFSYYVIKTFENEEIRDYIGDPDFRVKEFNSQGQEDAEEAIRIAYESVLQEIPSLPTAGKSPLDAMNAFLRVPGLYNEIKRRKGNVQFSTEARLFLNKLRRQGKTKFSRLDGAAQRSRKALNRLLLEDAFSEVLPKNDYIRGKEFYADTWSKFTYLYYKFKAIEDQK